MVEFECGESLKSKIKFLMILSLLFDTLCNVQVKKKVSRKMRVNFWKRWIWIISSLVDTRDNTWVIYKIERLNNLYILMGEKKREKGKSVDNNLQKNAELLYSENNGKG